MMGNGKKKRKSEETSHFVDFSWSSKKRARWPSPLLSRSSSPALNLTCPRRYTGCRTTRTTSQGACCPGQQGGEDLEKIRMIPQHRWSMPLSFVLRSLNLLNLFFNLFKPSTKNSGKTSLLFHYARSVAASTGRPVYFLTSAGAAAAGPPLLPATAASVVVGSGGRGGEGEGGGEGIAATATTDPFDLVQIKYVSSIADVVAFAACLHLLESEEEEGGEGEEGGENASARLPRRPAAVVIDGLSSLPPDENAAASSSSSRSFDRRAVEHAVLRALAVLSDATAGAWRRKEEKGKRRKEQGDRSNPSSSPSPSSPLPPIALVVAEEASPDGRAPFYLYRRWLPLVLTVRPAHEGLSYQQQQQQAQQQRLQHQNLLSLSPLPPAAGGTAVPPACASAAALYSFEGAGELEALGVAV